MIKSSKYNYELEDEEGNMLIMNVRTGSTFKVEKDYIVQYNELLTNMNEENKKSKVHKELLNKGILINEEFDELKYLCMKEREMAYGNDTLSIEIMPTLNCNFRCKYCFESMNKYEMSNETEELLVSFLEKNIPRCKQFRLAWFGGEPLLCKEMVIRISEKAHEICKKNKVPMYGEISTNGYLLDFETFERLIKCRILEYQICLDGTRELHNISRPHYDNNNSYDVIVNNLLDIKNKVKSGVFQIAIRANVTPNLEACIETYLDEMNCLFGQDKRFSFIFQCVRDWGGERVTQEQIVESEQEIYNKYYKLARNKGMKGLRSGAFTPIEGNCCACRKNGFVIDPWGNLHKCSLAMFSKKYADINRIGYINKSGKAIIEEEKVAKWIVAEEDRERCKDCVLFPLCIGGRCPYSMNIQKKKNCIKYMTSMLDAYLLEQSLNGSIDSFEKYVGRTDGE